MMKAAQKKMGLPMAPEIKEETTNANVPETKSTEESKENEPRKGYDPKRQEFVMMYVIHKGV
jgi:hypothetical protein